MVFAYIGIAIAGLAALFVAAALFEKNYDETVKGIISAKGQIPVGGLNVLDETGVDLGKLEFRNSITVKFKITQPRTRLFKKRKVDVAVPQKDMIKISKGDRTYVYVVYGKITGFVKQFQLVGSDQEPDGFYTN